MRYRSRKSQLARTRRGGPCAWLGPLTLLLVVTFVPAAARAEDDDDKSIWNLDKRIFDEVIYSFGLTKKPKLDDQIGYQERPRLMVPSDHELPAPKAVDPKTVRQQKPKTDWRDHDSDAFTDPLRPSQLRAKSAAAGSSNAAASSNAAGSGRSADSTDPLPPSQLGSPGGFFGLFSGGNQRRDAQAAAPAPAPASEPPRRSLIDPPAGYQAASPSQPYGGARVGSTGPKPTDHALGSDQGF